MALTDTYRALDLTAAAIRLPRRPVIGANAGLEFANARPGLLDSAGVLAYAVGPHDTPDTEFTRIDGYVRFRAAAQRARLVARVQRRQRTVRRRLGVSDAGPHVLRRALHALIACA